MFTATPNPLEYPSFSISGPRILPIAEAEAIAEPATDPMSIADIILISAKPPGKKPTKALAKETSLRATPPLFINSPANMKNGIANNAKLSSPVAIRCETVVNAGKKGTLTKRVKRAEMIILHAIGVPIESSIKKLNKSMDIEKNSIMFSLKLSHKTYRKLCKLRSEGYTNKQYRVVSVMRRIFDLVYKLEIQVLTLQI